MTNYQRIELRKSEVRQRLNDLSATEGELTSDHESEMETLATEYRQLEIKGRAELIIESDASEAAADKFETEPDSEGREIRALEGRSRIVTYIMAGSENRSLSGPEAEYSAAVGLNGSSQELPLQLLAADADGEQRHATGVDTTARPRRWLDRLFNATLLPYLGFSMESVQAGAATYPVTSVGPNPRQRGKEEEDSARSFTISVTELNPTRLSTHLEYNHVDSARLGDLESALRRDIRKALTERLEHSIILGDASPSAAADDVTGLLGLTTVNEVTLTQTNKVKGDKTVAVFAGLIDGRHAETAEDVRIVTSVGTNTIWMSTLVASTADSVTLAQFMKASGFSYRVRGGIDTNTANNDFMALMATQKGIQGAGVCAVWPSMSLIYDPYSKANSGIVKLTGSTLWAFGLPRASHWNRLKAVSN